MKRKKTHLKSMIRVPTSVATAVLVNATEIVKITLAVTRLKSTSTSINFQNALTVETSPTSG